MSRSPRRVSLILAFLSIVAPAAVSAEDGAASPGTEAELRESILHYDEALRCAREFTDFVKPILDERRVDPGDDLLSKLATAEVEGERLDDEAIMAFLKLLFPAGADTTYLNLGSTLYALLTNRDQLDHVREDPATRCRLAGEEGLRWYPSACFQWRRALTMDPDPAEASRIEAKLRGGLPIPVSR